MKSNVKAIGKSILLVLFLITISSLLYAQQTEQLRIGKKSDIKFSTPTKVGDKVLKAGTYQVHHAVEGQDHVVTFKGTDHKEVARLVCKVDPLGRKATYTGVTIRTNANGEREVIELQVRGENVKHVF